MRHQACLTDTEKAAPSIVYKHAKRIGCSGKWVWHSVAVGEKVAPAHLVVTISPAMRTRAVLM